MGFFVQTDASVPKTVQKKDGDFLIQGDGLGVSADSFVQLDDGGESGEKPAPESKGGDDAGASAGAQVADDSQAPGEGGDSGGDEGEGPTVQQKSSGSGGSGHVSLSSYLQQSASGGSRMDATTNQRMSGAFGQDFSNVQLHTDGSAAKVCNSLGANAFATGNHVYFAGGKYSPGSESGDRLLAHELTHTVQQSGGVVGKSVAKSGVTMGSPGDPYEVEADNVASAVVSALHGGGGGDVQQVAKDEDGTGGGTPLPTLSLAQAIIQRKVSGIPDVQMDIGVTLGIIGVAVSAGAWLHSTGGSNTLSVNPNCNWLAARSNERNSYRAAHPWRTATMNVIRKNKRGTGEYYGCNMTWRYNGAEIIDVRLDNYYWQMIGSSSSTELKVFDDQAQSGRLGVRAKADWDLWGPGHWTTGEGAGWIGVDGSGNMSQPSWS